MKCLIKQKQCKFWNEIMGCDDHTNICKCETKNNSEVVENMNDKTIQK